MRYGGTALLLCTPFVIGPYATAVLRFQISFPDSYPSLPPLVTFSTDMFHPLITPLTTYMYTTDIQDNGTVSATDEERLPPGGFSLRHGFPDWFGRGRRRRSSNSGRQVSGTATQQTQTTPPWSTASAVPAHSSSVTSTPSSVVSPASSSATTPGLMSYMRTGAHAKNGVSTYEVLGYIRSAFDDEDVLDSIPLEAAGNPGAWHAWRTYRQRQKKIADAGSGSTPGAVSGSGTGRAAATARRPAGGGGEWNWEGVWEERSKRGITASLSEAVLYGGQAADEVINFLNMDEADIEGAKQNLLRTLGTATV
ncbi:hypothetical protein B0H66DRAFT_603078 [Apodospora peruviana]|uniref:UBC core domain-containing protein n=1 Tax=Apodospora peruviana TaxID=516989 RepID=A0AAE0I553_9PEZI|nr:hypothetical protein B0H66DRAFT_603078 [Apodospora peruviana]